MEPDSETLKLILMYFLIGVEFLEMNSHLLCHYKDSLWVHVCWTYALPFPVGEHVFVLVSF